MCGTTDWCAVVSAGSLESSSEDLGVVPIGLILSGKTGDGAAWATTASPRIVPSSPVFDFQGWRQRPNLQTRSATKCRLDIRQGLTEALFGFLRLR